MMDIPNNETSTSPLQQEQERAIRHTFDSEVELALDENLTKQLTIDDTTQQQQQNVELSSPLTPITSTTIDTSGLLLLSTSQQQTNLECNQNNNFVTLLTNVYGNSNESSSKLTISFLLSIFDNIVGPKCVHFWSTNLNQFNTYLLKYIAIHTLNGELYNQEKLYNNFKLRLYLISEINYAILTIFFDANTIQTQNSSSSLSTFSNNKHNDNRKTSVQSNQSLFSSFTSSTSSINNTTSNSNHSCLLNSFSIIVPLEYKQYLLDKCDLIINSFQNYILEFRVFAEIWQKVDNVTTAIKHLTNCINELCRNLYTLETRGIKSVNLKETYFCEIDSTIDKEFLVSALTSHLLTSMNSIVIGKSSTSINKMISTLAYFTSKEKLNLSCYSLADSSSLSSYFYIQGVVSENPDNLEQLLNSDLLLSKPTSTSIIDLCSNKVYRIALLSDYQYIRDCYLARKVKIYYNSLKKEDLLEEWPVSMILQPVNRSKSYLVCDLIKQMDFLEMQFGLREAFIELFVKNLYISALMLIEYVNNEITKHNQTNKTKAGLCLIVARKLMKELNYKNEEDLNIVIAYADYLKSDFSQSFQLKN